LNDTLTRNYTYLTVNAYAQNPPFGAGLYNKSGTITIQNTILAHNQSNLAHDCYGNITSLGHNLVGNSAGCTINSAPGDLFGSLYIPIDPKLADLADNGGGSQTSALLAGSPAIDAGDPSTCPAADQRGVTRPQGSACDIGAYEGTGSGALTPQIAIFNSSYDYKVPGKYLCLSPQTSCTNGADPDADVAYQFAKKMYQFYVDHFNRASLDNAGMMLVLSVNNSSGNNSYWNGYQAVFDNGFPQADDVVAHELTHGVTQFTSNLFYYYQSGAIDESISDLFGEYFDQTDGVGNDSPSAKWLFGEDLPGGAVRSMSNPPAFKNPDKMTSSYYYKGPNDNGGVHTNSGINNKAVYLMVDGGSFNGKTVASLGWEKTGALYYYVETHLLTSGSDYSDLYNALLQACSVLSGTDGITVDDCQQMHNALDAVQMNKSPSSSYNPEASGCPTGETQDPASLFSDGFENGNSQWTFAANTGNPHWSIAPGDVNLHYAADGQYALFGNDYDSTRNSLDQVSDTSAAMTNGVTIPPNVDTFLFFKHAFGFEYGVLKGTNYYFDGGVLEYTIDQGETWHDAKPLFNTGQNYKGSIYNTTLSGSNPLRGRSAFVGESHGYVSSSYALKTLAGKTVRFRWRIGTDYTGAFLGWVVDDVSIYACVGSPSTPVLAAPANGSLVNGYQPTLDWKSAANADHYEIEGAMDAKFSHIAFSNAEVIGSTSFPISSDLLSNTLYYWHVRTVNRIDVKSAWSSTWSFRTRLQAPELTAPANGDILHILLPTFTWSSIPGAISYTLVISTSPSYSSPVVNVKILSGTTTYTPAKDLPAGKKLYGRIMANGVNPSVWTTFTFTTPLPPSVPLLLSPANNFLFSSADVLTDYRPTLTWREVTIPKGASPFDHYELQISDAADFLHLLYPNDTVKTDLQNTSFQIPAPLLDNQRYYWRVRAHNQNQDFSSWATFSFHTAILRPGLTAPANAIPIHNLRPTFTWTAPQGAVSYTLVVSANPNLSSPLLNLVIYSPNYTVTKDLPAGKLLYWHVQANGPNGPSLWSDAWNFTTPVPPSIPVLGSPTNNALLTNPGDPPVYTPTLIWKAVTVPAGAPKFDHYELQVSDAASFATLLYPDSADSADTITLTDVSFVIPESLPADGDYYWRVRAVNSNSDFSSWAMFSFRTALIRPILTKPDNDPITPLNNLKPTFNWNSSPGAASYTIVISAYSNLSAPLIIATTQSTTYTPGANLPAGKVLYWRVKANGNNGPSLWSDTWGFRAK
jgi:hypothetical protein